ncbi:RNA polymerase II transcription mediator isoform X2 [Tasmannia lanceolata]|uniref:RNA polymerase II transcription mediator isoform X2 n=1 Tax=Tasmannia lanceolata TaxID=3420 RepID=UPI0040631E60
MDGSLKISVDKLPIKRLDAIDDNGIERFPRSEIGPEEKRLALIRRIDFTPVVERDTKKTKSSEEVATTTPWPWQSLVENLQLAHQELSVIIDLINTVETNDAVTVAGMTRPKQLSNEVLSDLAVSAATKLQCFRHLGKYFKQSAKALKQQVVREARFYGALIRLQQNWKVKRQRPAVPALSNEGFTIDLFDNSLSDPTVLHPSSISTVHVDHDPAGMLTVKLPAKSCRSIYFGFLGGHSIRRPRKLCRSIMCGSGEIGLEEAKKEVIGDEFVNECVKETQSALREIHRAIFDEQVFGLVNREALYPYHGVNVIGIQEDYLKLGISQEACVFLSLVTWKDADQKAHTMDFAPNGERGILPLEKVWGVRVAEEKRGNSGYPDPLSCEIYLKQILHENVFVRSKERCTTTVRAQISGQPAGDGCGFLGHFCMTLSHRIFSKKVMAELENLVSRVPYLHLLSLPTWHSRTSSWLLSIRVPPSILHGSYGSRSPDICETNKRVRSQFYTKVVVNNECISVSGEGGPNVAGLFRGSSVDVCSMSCYDCDLADLPVASQVVRWLHEEAQVVGMKAGRDFLGLSFELEQGDTLGLVAHVDPNDAHGCISWWLVMEEGKFHSDFSNDTSESRRFLGHLSLESLYSTLMDMVSLCTSSGIH